MTDFMRAAGRLTIFSLSLCWYVSFAFTSVFFLVLSFSSFLGVFLLRILHLS